MSALADMIVAARLAGKIQRAAFNSAIRIEEKGAANAIPDMVTRIDRESEESIRQALSNYAVVGEEQGGTPSEKYMLVDPLDGTKNFLCGVDHFAICLTYIENNLVKAAVVYDAINEKLFTADNEGALLNGEPIQIKDAPLRHTYLISEEDLSKWGPLLRIKRAARDFAGVRKFGSTAHNLGMMAGGMRGVLVASGLKPWDFQGAAFIYQMAGGQVSDMDGQPITMQSTSLVAAPPTHHAHVINKLRPGLFQAMFLQAVYPQDSARSLAMQARVQYPIANSPSGIF